MKIIKTIIKEMDQSDTTLPAPSWEVKKFIQSKIAEMQKEPAALRKVFTFSMEDLQDKPDECLSEIYAYLYEHRDKIEDFWFSSYIDDLVFKPKLVMHVVPIESIRENLTTSHWEKLVGVDLAMDKVEGTLKEIISQYAFEFNTPETRAHMIGNLTEWLKSLTDDFDKNHCEVIDESTPEIIDQQGFAFTVLREGNRSDLRMSLHEYLRFLHKQKLLNKRRHC